MEAYLIDTAAGQIKAGWPRAELVRDVLLNLFGKTGAPARRLQEIHWLESSANLLEPGLLAQTRDIGLLDTLAVFQWPSAPLLAHFVLQAAVRSIAAGERDLVLVAQFGQTGQLSQDHLIMLLLASPQAVGRHNLAPQVRFARMRSLNGRAAGFAETLRELSAPDPVEEDQQENTENESPKSSTPLPIRWLGAARPVAGLVVNDIFPGADWVGPDPETPAGDLFVLGRLLERLAEQKDRCGVWLTEGPQTVRLATLIERI